MHKFKLIFCFTIQILLISLDAEAATAVLQDYSHVGISPMITPQNLNDWLSKVDSLPTEPHFNEPSVSTGTLMARCNDPASSPVVILSSTPCYNTDAMTAPDSGLGPITDNDRLVLIQYFALRFGIQTDPAFFRPQFFNPAYVPPSVLAASTANGPSILNAYAGCIRRQIYALEQNISDTAPSSPSSLNGYFNDPYTVLAKSSILSSIQLGVYAEFASAQRLAKFFDYAFPDAFGWEMLLIATGLDSRCGS